MTISWLFQSVDRYTLNGITRNRAGGWSASYSALASRPDSCVMLKIHSVIGDELSTQSVPLERNDDVGGNGIRWYIWFHLLLFLVRPRIV